MPLSIVEHQSFHQFLSIVDNKYSPVSRRTITSKIDSLVEERQIKLKNELAMADNVSVTVVLSARIEGGISEETYWCTDLNVDNF